MRVKLLKLHEHAGRKYPVDTELNLTQSDADWLIALGVAKPVAEAPAASGKGNKTTTDEEKQ